MKNEWNIIHEDQMNKNQHIFGKISSRAGENEP